MILEFTTELQKTWIQNSSLKDQNYHISSAVLLLYVFLRLHIINHTDI